jgi:Uma2 family endonuclease
LYKAKLKQAKLMKPNIKLTDKLRLSNEGFFDFCVKNRELLLERDSEGNVINLPFDDLNTSMSNGKILMQLFLWNKEEKIGKVIGSKGGFTLADSSVRAADVAFLSNEKWNSLSEEERDKFAKVCPDFVIELRSKSDNLKELKEKMEVWITNGVPLAWLVNPKDEEVYIYKANQPIEIIKGFDKFISGEPILKGFEFDLKLLLS